MSRSSARSRHRRVRVLRANSRDDRYELIKNVVNSQNFVANYALRDHPVTEADILHRGPEAFHVALNTVNVCKYNLGWGAVGMCTHAMYEAVTHASNRAPVRDRRHRLHPRAAAGRRRLCAAGRDEAGRHPWLRLHAQRSADDRRYLLYSPLTKAKITSEGERVIIALGCHRRQGRGEGHLFEA